MKIYKKGRRLRLIVGPAICLGVETIHQILLHLEPVGPVKEAEKGQIVHVFYIAIEQEHQLKGLVNEINTIIKEPHDNTLF